MNAASEIHDLKSTVQAIIEIVSPSETGIESADDVSIANLGLGTIEHFLETPAHEVEQLRVLRDFLSRLPDATLLNLVTVMYCGRERRRDCLTFRDELVTPYPDSESRVRVLVEKSHCLKTYLSTATDLLLDHQFTDLENSSAPIPRYDKAQPSPSALCRPAHVPIDNPRSRDPLPIELGELKTRGYEAIEPIGEGGNGAVYKARCEKSSMLVAIKIMHGEKSKNYRRSKKGKKGRSPAKRYLRFKSEIEAMKTAAPDNANVMPLLDSFIPPQRARTHDTVAPESPTFPYIVMPLGKPTSTAFPDALWERLGALSDLAQGLARLHAAEIYHRDIKPANILLYDGKWRFSDFGLARFPGSLDLTGSTEKLGPFSFMAPEMRSRTRGVNYAAADVYSFAKTCWALLKGEAFAFEGQYDPDADAMSLMLEYPREPLARLENMIHAATEFEPTRRPTAATVAAVLKSITDPRDSPGEIAGEWNATLARVFPRRAPHRTRWHDVEAIAFIIRQFGRTGALSHWFLQGGGGHDIRDAHVTHAENGEIALDVGGSRVTLRPEWLDLVYWPNAPDWSYLDMKVRDSVPVPDSEVNVEALTETVYYAPNGSPITFEAYQEGGLETNGRFVEFNGEATRGMRLLGGRMVCFSKDSHYNRDLSTYDGRHARMNPDEFYSYIAQHVENHPAMS